MALEITDQNFSQIISNNKISLIDFYADWCGPCKAMSSHIEQLHEKIGEEFNIGKVNVEDNAILSTQFNIRNLPTVIILKNGEEVTRLIGLQTSDSMEKALSGVRY